MPERSALPAGAARRVITGLLFWGGVQLVGNVFERSETVAVAVQAVVAEWGAGALGISWSDPQQPRPSWAQLRFRIGVGLLLGFAAASAAIGAMVLVSGSRLCRMGGEPGMLLLALVVAVLAAVRDELLLRGFVLTATRDLIGTAGAMGACGVAAAAARFGIDGVVTPALLADGLRGVALSTVWMRDRGAWAAVAANTAWTLTAGPLVHGALFDLSASTDVATSAPGLVVLALAAAIGFVLGRRR
jgi:hypothetical protein